jgi:hypothetical protein
MRVITPTGCTLGINCPKVLELKDPEVPLALPQAAALMHMSPFLLEVWAEYIGR